MSYTYSGEIQDGQRANIAHTFNQSTFSDVKFIIGEEETEFSINRIFLASISDVFKAMLFGNMKESKPNATIIIKDIDVNGFECVLNYAYCKNPNITVNNIVSAKHICRKYQIVKLSSICDKHFDSFINCDTVCLLLNEATNYRLDEYIKKCDNIIKTKLGIDASKIINSQSFMNMQLHALQIFLQYDYLNIKEEMLWEAVIKWTEHHNQMDDFVGAQPANKKRKLNSNSNNNANSKENKLQTILKSICPNIRFGLMDGSYFVQSVQPKNCLTKDESLSICNYILCINNGNSQVKCDRFNITKRIECDVVIKRGTVSDDSWNYYGEKNDAICIASNKNVNLTGIGIFNCEGTVDVSCKVYEGENYYNDETKANVIYDLEKQTFQFQDVTDVPVHLEFKQHVLIKKDVKYTIEIMQLNGEKKQSAGYIKDGQLDVISNGLKIKFSNAKSSENSTDVEQGAIPTLYFSVLV